MVASLACAGAPRPLAAQEVADADIDKLAARTIFFGHQSVGWNIIQGIEATLKAHPAARWPIREIKTADAEGPGLLHAELGQNGNPLSKLEAFEHLVRGGIGDHANVAFFKFCYADFDKDSDVAGLFERYKRTMAELAQAYPKTTFAHVTAPLMAPEQGIKAMIKQALGRYDPANAKRNAFNELLRREYAGSGRLFDLAVAESTKPDGSQCTVSAGDQRVPCLVPDYTDDGAHLNALGRNAVSPRFVAFLAGLD
ncbi:hypothetical protein BV133_413 [Blastochloris viridis]|uniref:SGNH hydrolase-type esterase domain-containing protein n=1 Tax=Blastochloris viridis TaxID=1079 RepID=A0A182CXS4_BLAVI|nr:hypothetical protein BV133_413 [Blastochloris viridis]